MDTSSAPPAKRAKTEISPNSPFVWPKRRRLVVHTNFSTNDIFCMILLASRKVVPDTLVYHIKGNIKLRYVAAVRWVTEIWKDCDRFPSFVRIGSSSAEMNDACNDPFMRAVCVSPENTSLTDEITHMIGEDWFRDTAFSYTVDINALVSNPEHAVYQSGRLDIQKYMAKGYSTDTRVIQDVLVLDSISDIVKDVNDPDIPVNIFRSATLYVSDIGSAEIWRPIHDAFGHVRIATDSKVYFAQVLGAYNTCHGDISTAFTQIVRSQIFGEALIQMARDDLSRVRHQLSVSNDTVDKETLEDIRDALADDLPIPTIFAHTMMQTVLYITRRNDITDSSAREVLLVPCFDAGVRDSDPSQQTPTALSSSRDKPFTIAATEDECARLKTEEGADPYARPRKNDVLFYVADEALLRQAVGVILGWWPVEDSRRSFIEASEMYASSIVDAEEAVDCEQEEEEQEEGIVGARSLPPPSIGVENIKSE